MGTKNSFTNFILLALEKTVDGYVRLEDLLYNPGFYAYGSGWDKPLKKSELARTVKRLRVSGLIELTEGDEIILKLTDSGMNRALWAKMKMIDEKWDGYWRMVIWDIPEKRRATRDLLRMKLKQLGFQRWQKSVWASKKNCTDILRKFIKEVGIDDWVMVIESKNVGDVGFSQNTSDRNKNG